MAHPLINKYCVVSGLQSPAARPYNGRECLVVKVDPENSERLAVYFTFNIGSGAEGRYVSLKPDNLTPKYGVEIRPSAYGSGLFATKDFKRGDTIISELPFLSFVGNLDFEAVKRSVDALSEPERTALEGLTGDGVSAEVAEAARETDATYAPWFLRMKVNSLGAPDDSSSLYPVICRINHCCSSKAASNVWWYATSGSRPRTITASRDIKEGEEILSDYAVTRREASARKDTLNRYGIVCDCAVCSANEKLAGALYAYEVAFSRLDALSTAANRSGAALPPSMNLAYVKSTSEEIAAAIAGVGSSFPEGESGERMVTNLSLALSRAQTEAVGTLFRAMMNASVAPAPEYPTQLFEAIKAYQQEGLAVRLAACAGNKKHPFYEEAKSAADTNAQNFSALLHRIKSGK